jgi:hypothetical protein
MDFNVDHPQPPFVSSEGQRICPPDKQKWAAQPQPNDPFNPRQDRLKVPRRGACSCR